MNATSNAGAGSRRESSGADCIVVTPPFSPNDASPPLGPALLKAHVEAAGFSLRFVDLNIRYLLTFEGAEPYPDHVVGDHDADETRNEEAKGHFFRSLCLPPVESSRLPCCDEANSSLPHTFDELDAALAGMESDRYWPELFDRHVFDAPTPPSVLGVSVMGPAQVPLAMLLARCSKRRWPQTTVVVGGSHITLLAKRIARNARYSGEVDYFLPGHSEGVLVEMLRRAKRGQPLVGPGVLCAGGSWQPGREIPPDERLAPTFEPDGLPFYPRRKLTLPVQIGRGCGYGRCTYCTYPVVEVFERVSTERMARRFLPPLLELQPASISVKDSLFTVPSMQEFGREVRQLDSELGWSATTKVTNAMTPACMRELHALGCRTLELGIETILPSSQRFFDKVEPLDNIEGALNASLDAGIAVVVNMIYGVPGETLDDARRQLAWWLEWKRRAPELIFGVHNLLQIDEGSPLALWPERHGLDLAPTGPWSFTYIWNAPEWRPRFEREIDEAGGRVQ